MEKLLYQKDIMIYQMELISIKFIKKEFYIFLYNILSRQMEKKKK
jgi:hypothetical protein